MAIYPPNQTTPAKGSGNYLWNWLGSSLKKFGAAISPYITGGDPYKKYVALLTQTGINPPVATVFENTIGNIVWTRDSLGAYKATLNGAFIINKTMVNAWLDWFDCAAIYAVAQTGTIDYCYFYAMADANYSSPTYSDLNGKGMWVEIRIYP